MRRYRMLVHACRYVHSPDCRARWGGYQRHPSPYCFGPHCHKQVCYSADQPRGTGTVVRDDEETCGVARQNVAPYKRLFCLPSSPERRERPTDDERNHDSLKMNLDGAIMRSPPRVITP
ncbi:MAG: hypothetical protein AVDCRST_MAG93-3878 [uncultured Chloroflexia bacterium]|uniref:Uncharacterized protein n=1 Tax=uncultured Chloroflexia bacterium TaxID=1672391 RepID=A0A6J4JY62_9CHLR|nr:MAG: hypothetical protein AVDCRST_MAG93-3878 [uncultured Chloroflexia bacterium]